MGIGRFRGKLSRARRRTTNDVDVEHAEADGGGPCGARRLAASTRRSPLPAGGEAAGHRWSRPSPNARPSRWLASRSTTPCPWRSPTTGGGPDGSPLAEPPCDRPGRAPRPIQDVVFRAIAVRISGYPRTPTTNGRSAPPAEARESARLRARKSRACSRPSARSRGPGDLHGRVLVAADPWQTVRTSDGRNQFGPRFEDWPEHPFRQGVSPPERPWSSRSRTIIKDMAVRLVAVGLDGKEYPASNRTRAESTTCISSQPSSTASREDPGGTGFSPALTNGWRSPGVALNPLAAASGASIFEMTGVARDHHRGGKDTRS